MEVCLQTTRRTRMARRAAAVKGGRGSGLRTRDLVLEGRDTQTHTQATQTQIPHGVACSNNSGTAQQPIGALEHIPECHSRRPR